MDPLFITFSALTLIPAFFMVISRNPVNGAMMMILSLIGMAGLFLLLDAFLIGVLQVLVYAGAVMVLFLFIIMLLDIEESERIRPRTLAIAGAGVGGLLLVSGIVSLLQFSRFDLRAAGDTGAAGTAPFVFSTDLSSYGYALFTKYLLAFQVAGVLLLVAMVGVIVISKKLEVSGKEGGAR